MTPTAPGETADRARRATPALIAACVVMMLLGIALRFTFLGTKIYANDEATTSVHISGKTIAQYAAAMFDGKPHTGSELLRFQQPDAAHGPADVVRSLAVEDPQHPPLYYLLERQSEEITGSEIWARRFLAAVFGALAVLCAVWFGLELDSLAAGLICGALVAASPFAIAYSQVAREYSLWLALTFAASALLVRAMRGGRGANWLLYCAVTVAGLYTDALFILVVVAHALALVLPTPRRRATMLGFAASLVVIVAAYAPWLAALFAGYTRGTVTNNVYLSAGLSLKPFILKWIFNIGSLFYDADYRYPKTAVLLVPGLIALALAFVFCVRRLRSRPSLSLIVTLGAVAVVALVVPDVLHHEQRSTASRYLVPLWVACYAALGVALAGWTRSSTTMVRRAAFGFVGLTALTGFGSFAVSARHDTWWVDGATAPIGSIARAISSTAKPVVVYHATWGPGTRGVDSWDFSAVMLADVVSPSTTFVQYGRDEDVARMPAANGTLLLLDPSDAEVAALDSRGESVLKVAGGKATPLDADIATLRQTVERERAQQAIAANLSPIPSIWSVQAR